MKKIVDIEEKKKGIRNNEKNRSDQKLENWFK